VLFDRDNVLIIAEAGVNHNGSIEMALQLVDAAKDAGANAVKFQTFKANKLVSMHTAKAEYQKVNTNCSETQLSMLQKLELSHEDHKILIKHCSTRDIAFMSSPFDHESLNLLVKELQLPIIKLGSGELTNAPLLLAIAQTGKPLILSTGMSTLAEVKDALGVLAFGYLNLIDKPRIDHFRAAFESSEGKVVLADKVTLLHCTTEYPAPIAEVNLKAMNTLAESFGLCVGFSDHTEGWLISAAAVVRGAQVIEKHFTLDRSLPGPDHQASLEPDELRAMVVAIRQVESALGDGIKRPAPSEIKNIAAARKSLVAAEAIASGETFTLQNLAVKRPGNGVSPFRFWEFLGHRSERSYTCDEVVKN